MLTTRSRSVNSNRCGVSASRSLGPMSGSSLISANVRSMTSRNSVSELNAAIRRRSVGAAPSTPAQARRPLWPTTIHLHPTAPLAERVLLPGDPGRALRLAQALLRRAEDVQPQPRAVGVHRRGGRRRAADHPEHRDGRAERGDRARGAGRPGRAAARPGRDLRRARRRMWGSAS